MNTTRALRHIASRSTFALLASLALAACGVDAIESPDTGRAEDTVDARVDTRVGDADVVPGEPAWSVSLQDLPAALLSVWGRSWDDLWAVGADKGDGTGPWVIHGTSDGFARLDMRPADPDGGAIWWAFGPDASSVYFVGEGGRIFLHNPLSGELDKLDSGTDATLYGIWGADGDELWAVGGYVHPRTGPPTIVRIESFGLPSST